MSGPLRVSVEVARGATDGQTIGGNHAPHGLLELQPDGFERVPTAATSDGGASWS